MLNVGLAASVKDRNPKYCVRGERVTTKAPADFSHLPNNLREAESMMTFENSRGVSDEEPDAFPTFAE